ncbi:DUF262 domain-containing protein [Lysinibacillus fusiformis]|uniref:Uncharacterized conserved protein, contains ParB-like and HNH nuclease domains n=3 Tax=Lysinibacillus TaxID=400634 RepID=A0A1H9JIA8_9BACI|nr:DUF262 domain-containing protein [Lysinibacillus fusiformis]SCY43331.1 Uncharacterized conserved protein, contains ParB-like and HNH nuclease domains [Lysinibacillus fusiformis]SEN74659.1 Uncharacterized conserved protein, contains ParB-like and HNH nuclease domains [Lysinibacillus fusiformis]SEQ86644.1 Uncharacterized conserved protein, contains ParB-like and HNH nuclease domains [Lysinibacillus fusiformis]
MATTIEVNKQSVKQLLETGKVNKFIIPEYQRPYAWSDEQIQTLFEDLVEYTENNNESTYFLGTIVSYENENGEQEIIDGQQRITSLFLLLRALYSKLNSMTETKEVKNFKGQIESALWEQDELTAEVDFEKTLIESRVMRDEGNKVFSEILITGDIGVLAKDNYSLNYRLFTELIERYATNEPQLFFYFIRNVLNKAILLPITADSQDTALTIFSTLNDRGLALSDADIFKAKIYNQLDADGKVTFIEQWQKLDDEATNANESIQKLFYYYMFYLRALENDRNTTTPGIRKYYSRNNFEQLYKSDVMGNLSTVLNLWLVVNNRVEIEDEEWSKNIEIKQVLDILTSYPNEFWKYPVVIYYLKYNDSENFEELFLKFLKKLLAVLAARYIITPTINAVKRGILNLNSEIIKSPIPTFDFSKVSEQELKDKIKHAHRNTVRMILKILAYQSQNDILPEKWEIEHILPQKWQTNYFPNNSESEVQELVEHIGNKVPFEKKLNIIAGNGYFKKKQQSYEKSKVQLVLNLSKNHNDWGLNEIRERDIRISDELLIILNDWGLNQPNTSAQDETSPVPTAEELKMIEELKSKGLI